MFELIILIIVLGVLIFVHEFGHFIVAKRSGMKVEEFGFGFPPRIWGIKRGETIYSINWIPLGGFVRILGEDGKDKDNPRSFSHATPGPRAKVVVAGVIMNILLAIVLLSILNMTGSRIQITDDNASRARDIEVNIVGIAPDSPAEDAGFIVGDVIAGLSIADEMITVDELEDVQIFVEDHKGEEIIMSLLRNSESIDVPVVPRLDPPEGEGALGIGMITSGLVTYPVHIAIWRSVQDTGTFLWRITTGFGAIVRDLATGGDAIKQIAGPVGIAVISGNAARAGFSNLIFFTAIISLNLTILNILPIPPLDGGKLLFIILEKLRKGKPVAQKIEMAVSSVGFLLLIALVVYATINDIGRFF
ncbi:MAG: M50 family metallopeptidase [Parcubacteria group bacterium]